MGKLPQHPPFGALVVTYRLRGGQPEFLLRHRAASGPDFEGEWAWGPPGGNREEGETIDQCATRELYEETGFHLTPRRTEGGSPEWVVYLAEVPSDQEPALSAEHDRFVWLPYDDAVARISPTIVQSRFVGAVASVLRREKAPSESRPSADERD